MRKLLDRLHARLGDFWWYSLMVFMATRLADVINVFVGLWLVPKYVSSSELGAVMPLISFSGFLAIPVTVFATVFMKELNALAIRGAYGQVKTLMRGVFLVAGIVLVLAIVASRLLLPVFLERIRIVEGSLGFLILASAFVSTVAPVYTNALQALKRFRALSLLQIAGAPLRFVTMYLTMPFRALSSYFVGQCAPSVVQIAGSVLFLRKELGVPPEPYWSKDILKRFTRLLAGTFGFYISCSLCNVIEQMVLRQRLPDVESAAFYFITRFSEIATCIAVPLTATLFPFTAELAERGKSTRPLALKCIAVISTVNLVLALGFALCGKWLIAVVPGGELYAAYAWAIPVMIGVSTLGCIQGLHTNTEISAGRFGFLKWWIPLNLGYPLLMVLVSGYGYFVGLLPGGLVEFLREHNVTSLRAVLCWMSARSALAATLSVCELLRQREPSRKAVT